MKKQTIADKMAQKSFFSPQIQNSWKVHQKAFGPILEPAFSGNAQAKVHLCAALNHISTRNLPQALLKLNQVEKCCETDADKAALCFFMGLWCETAGQIEQMAELYTRANTFGHKFYLPYLKVAKYQLDTYNYAQAAENYRAAIDCFSATGPSTQEKKLLSSAYTNLASCLTMMHRYEEADAALETSRTLLAEAPGRAAVEALLYAIRGDQEQAERCLQLLKTHVPAAWEAISASVQKILDGTDPAFFILAVEEEKITGFWAWFQTFSPELKKKFDRKEYDAGIADVTKQLHTVFPFLEQPPYVSLGVNDRGYVLELKDLYAVSLMEGYAKLLSACPDCVKENWLFVVVH